MSETMRQLLAQIETLPPDERAELAYFVLRSLDERKEEDSAEAWQAELDRRVAQIRSGQATAKPADQLFAGLRPGLGPRAPG